MVWVVKKAMTPSPMISRRHREAGRRYGKAPQMPGARQDAGVVADDDEDEEGGEHGEVLAPVLLAQILLIIVAQVAHRHLRRVLQRPGHILEPPGRQPTEQREHGDDDPHGGDGACHLQRADGKQNIARMFSHGLTSSDSQGSRRKTGPFPSQCMFLLLYTNPPGKDSPEFRKKSGKSALPSIGRRRLRAKLVYVIANQCAHWCGNPYSLCGNSPSAHTGVATAHCRGR